MDIEKLCSDAKLIGWSPETTIKHLHDLAEHFPQLSFSHNSRTEINAEVAGALHHGVYAIANLMRENATLQTENEKLRDEVERQRRSADNRQHLYENAERAYMKVLAELEQAKREQSRIPEGYALVKLELLEELDNFRDLGPIDRLRELKKADDEGLPFKPPRWVYVCSTRFPKPAQAHYASAINVLQDMDKGCVFGDTQEEAAAALRREQDG